jgi:hypothetical protein
MKTKHILAAASLAVAMMLPSAANARNNPVDIYDLSLEQNLELPEVKSGKQADRVTAFQYNAAVAYKKKNLDVELMRDGEVIIITFQSTRLFAVGTKKPSSTNDDVSALNSRCSTASPPPGARLTRQCT